VKDPEKAMHLSALLLTLSSALLIYLTHPQQRLLRAPLPTRGRRLGYAVLLTGAWAWCKTSGPSAGLAGALTTLMFAWVLLPYIAWWSGRHTFAAKAGKQ
jgi:hypothetical protein